MNLTTMLKQLPDEIKIEGDIEHSEIFLNGKNLQIEASQRVRNHSQEFSWGYGGSGPGQLALAILMEFMPVSFALQFYIEFKFQVVARWPQDHIEETVKLKWEIENILAIRT